MSLSKNEIECYVDSSFDEAISELFGNEFYSLKEIEYALSYLKDKVENLEAEDFEDSIV